MKDPIIDQPSRSPAKPRARLPRFLLQQVPHGARFHAVTGAIQEMGLNTVCEEAKCPNRTHCYARGTLAFQILGDVCTRACGFCGEAFGRVGRPVDAREPARLVETARRLALTHVVVTSPARDDLHDQGAAQFAAVVTAFRAALPDVTVELLTPDFEGRAEFLEVVFAARPDIFNHNVETVRRLTPRVRSKATYDRSLDVLRRAAEANLRTKSGLMVGHGETRQEITETLRDIRGAGCKMLTVGQYLPPSARHLPLVRTYLPAEFDEIREDALALGFADVAAAPLVRSSYYADRAAAGIRAPQDDRMNANQNPC